MSRKASKKTQTQPTTDELIQQFGEIADHAWQTGYSGLQDISLLLVDALRDISANDPDNTTFLPIAQKWPLLVEAYNNKAQSAIADIISYLREPTLNLPLADEEFAMLEAQLNNDNPATAPQSVAAIDNDAPHYDYPAEFAQLADQAAQYRFFGLQDACLLMAEGITTVPPEDAADLVQCLDGWPDLVEAYKKAPANVAAQLLTVMREPMLNIPLAEDEFAALSETLLDEQEITATADNFKAAAAHHEDNVAETVNSSLLTPAAQEILIMMVSQADKIGFVVNEINLANPGSTSENLSLAEDLLQYFGVAADTAGFASLAKLFNHVVVNLSHYQKNTAEFTEDQLNLLRDWIGFVKEYLLDITDATSGQQLVFSTCDNDWAIPLPMEAAAEILTKIRSEGTDVQAYQEAATRKETAEAEDVSLELPDDVNQELLDLMLQELPVQTQQFSEAVQRMQTGGTVDDVQIAQRIAHTLKGTANTVGIKGIAVLTHNLEDILTACSKEERLPNKALVSVLLNASDCLEGMSEALLGMGAVPGDSQNVLQEVLDWANRIDKEGVPQADETVELTGAQTTEIAGDHADTAQTQATTVRVASDQIENLFRLSGENIILNGQAQESIRRLRGQIKLMQQQFALLQDLGVELERLIDLRDLSGRIFGVSDMGFDSLEMDQYNELHTVSRRMAESAVDAREISVDVSRELDSMEEVLNFQQGFVINAQEIVMQTRLVPISSIVPRLQRSLRQTCRLTGKECDLKVTGQHNLVDGDTLNALVGPIMHVLRNAVDHGIESEDERKVMGKPSKGLLIFDFSREGNNIHLRCRDDGRGLDYGAIRAAAERRLVIKPGEETSEEDLKKLILRPNFSTRTVTTQTSGRGVGMDVVRSEIVNLGGTLTLESVAGQGLTVVINVPLPLSLTYALITNVGRYKVAIATKGITQILYSAEGDLIELDGKEALQLEANIYPTERLENILGVSNYQVERLNDMLHIPDKRKQTRTYSAALLVQNEDKFTAVLIGPVVNSLDVVIKGMGPYVGKIPGYIGATILGDGTVTPVLDLPELLRMPARTPAETFAEPQQTAEPASMLPIVLVVDDSLSQRRALEQLLKDAGYRTRTARDGIEAADLLLSFKPDIVLTDLEMPRMNGIELGAHIRTQSRLRDLPVIMITSRSTQKHKQMAAEAGINAYFTKPVRDEELLIKVNELLELSGNQQRASA